MLLRIKNTQALAQRYVGKEWPKGCGKFKADAEVLCCLSVNSIEYWPLMTLNHSIFVDICLMYSEHMNNYYKSVCNYFMLIVTYLNHEVKGQRLLLNNKFEK